MIDWQMTNVTPTTQGLGDAIDADFQASGLLVVPRDWRGDPADLLPVPYIEVVGRRKFGGPGDPTALLHILMNVWPFVAGGLAGAMADDVWGGTKRGLKYILHHVLADKAGSASITIVGRDPEPTYEVDRDDLTHLDEAVDALSEHWGTAEWSSRERVFRWNPGEGQWELVDTTTTHRVHAGRMTPSRL
ncbi:MAG: hypothetical protein E6J14_12665 [Chloroflexi bacterium]|nr:MAG: hypothetical protein E6J14_12665 [Chloroflexota bacterium]